MLDYGTLLCWADNNIGSQSQPCVFHLIPAQPPAPINDCSISHRDTSSVGVTCHTQTRDSAVSLTFVLELWRTGDVNIIRNLSSSSGDWSLGGLIPGQEYQISVFTTNVAGVSSRYNSTFLTYKTEFAESRIHLDNSNNFVITPILGALIGVGVALSFVTITIVIVVCCKHKRQHSSDVMLHSDDNGHHDHTGQKELLSPDMAPRKILCDVDDDESGFEQLYSDRQRYSSFNRQLCNKNIFIVVRKTIGQNVNAF